MEVIVEMFIEMYEERKYNHNRIVLIPLLERFDNVYIQKVYKIDKKILSRRRIELKKDKILEKEEDNVRKIMGIVERIMYFDEKKVINLFANINIKNKLFVFLILSVLKYNGRGNLFFWSTKFCVKSETLSALVKKIMEIEELGMYYKTKKTKDGKAISKYICISDSGVEFINNIVEIPIEKWGK